MASSPKTIFRIFAWNRFNFFFPSEITWSRKIHYVGHIQVSYPYLRYCACVSSILVVVCPTNMWVCVNLTHAVAVVLVSQTPLLSLSWYCVELAPRLLPMQTSIFGNLTATESGRQNKKKNETKPVKDFFECTRDVYVKSTKPIFPFLVRLSKCGKKF